MTTRSLLARSLALLLSLSFATGAAEPRGEEDDATAPDPALAVEQAVRSLVGMQEGEGPSEWPYEGVYRVREAGKSVIPIGYRVGGTSIVGAALLRAPGYSADEARQAAIARALEFVLGAPNEPLMSPDYDGGYDVRGWGYIYALDFLLLLERNEAVPERQAAKVKKAIQSYVSMLEDIEIPESGGWSYSRSGALDQDSATSPFMTGPALQALFAAKQQGYKVSIKLVERGLDALERSRLESGEVVYSSQAKSKARGGQLPGSVGRMLVTESTLYLAGRGSQALVRGALDSFLVHWDWLDERRAKDKTHLPPYGVAPYYFYYAHFQAAQAIELLPEAERAEYRRRFNAKLFSVRLEDGNWNDRVFPRTANYGTAISVLALTMQDAPGPARWGK